MHLTTLAVAVFAALATALPATNSQQLSKRQPECGVFYDEYFGMYTHTKVYGDNADS
jgi:hypothetical protein